MVLNGAVRQSFRWLGLVTSNGGLAGTDMKPERNTLAQEMKLILARLQELEKMDFPQYRSCRRAEGTEVDREPVPEYLEQEELIRRWRELREIEQCFHREHNQLLISLRLWRLSRNFDDPIDDSLQHRIAISVFRNAGIA